MAARLRFGDRERMEEVLGNSSMKSIAEQCRIHRVPLDAWHRCQGIARGWEAVAVRRLAERMTEPHAMTERLELAAQELGLSPSTIERRIERWATESRRNPT
jgi:AraC-like DNA-binding protein